jgi:hypothetical protein
LSTSEDGSSKGYGHVEFATVEAAQKVNHLLDYFHTFDMCSLVQLLQEQNISAPSISIYAYQFWHLVKQWMFFFAANKFLFIFTRHLSLLIVT